MFQADSEELKLAWINSVQGCIDMAYCDQITEQNTQVQHNSYFSFF